MQNKELFIGTVTYGDRWQYLNETIQSFMENTDLSYLNWKWIIYGNNPSPDSMRYLRELEDLDKRFYVVLDPNNIGIGPAMDWIRNHIIKMSYDFNSGSFDLNTPLPYLFLEDDWVCLPSKLTGVKDTWLNSAVDQMMEKNIDIVYFRRYVDIFDAKKHFWHDKRQEYTFAPEPRDVYFDGMRCIRLNPTFWNNPHLMNLRASYDIYPLVREDRIGVAETKDSTTWGASENQATFRVTNGPMKAYYAFNGIFAHYDYLLYHYKTENNRFVYDHEFDKNQYNYISNCGL